MSKTVVLKLQANYTCLTVMLAGIVVADILEEAFSPTCENASFKMVLATCRFEKILVILQKVILFFN